MITYYRTEPASPGEDTEKEPAETAAVKGTEPKKEEQESYYFENKEEFFLYVKVCRGTKNIAWLSGDN